MEMPHHFTGSKSSADTGVVKFIILDENRSAVVRVQQFATSFAASVGCSCDISASTWREDSSDHQETADDGDYLIVALFKECTLSVPVCEWIEDWLVAASKRGAGVIVLADAQHYGCLAVDATRHYLRCVCIAKSVAFSVCVLPPAESGEEVLELASLSAR